MKIKFAPIFNRILIISAFIYVSVPSFKKIGGTRFRPLSLDVPKPLFPIAGLPMIQHHIEACAKISNLHEVIIIGSYQVSELHHFVQEMMSLYKLTIRYLQEFTPLGTAGGMYHFRDQIISGNTKYFFILNGDVCADFPLQELLEFHKKKHSLFTIMATEATRQQSLNYGCMVLGKNEEVAHYVEKPSTFVSSLINCGVYVTSPEVFQTMADVFYSNQDKGNVGCQTNGYDKDPAHISLEQDVLSKLAGTGKMYALSVANWWSQLKTAGAAIYANRHYLNLYRSKKPERLVPSESYNDRIIGDVYIHPTASVDSTCVLGPNVSIGAKAFIGPGVRIRESIVMGNAQIQAHSVVLHSIVGRNSFVGQWARVEGTPCDPNPNKPFAKMENPPLFNVNGKLNPAVTILSTSVSLASEKILLNSIVLPHKQLSRNFKNEIIL